MVQRNVADLGQSLDQNVEPEPGQRREIAIQLIYKGSGDPADISNYRPSYRAASGGIQVAGQVFLARNL